MNTVEAADISLSIGKIHVLHNVNLVVPSKSIFGIVGCNGAGKTSLLRVLSGLVPFQQGKLKLFGDTDLSKGRKRVGTYMEFLEPDKSLNAETYLYRICEMFRVNTSVIPELLEQVGLSGQARKEAGIMSLGMRRRLMLACALAGQPELLLLDEPFNGVDPQGVEDIGLLLLQLRAKGVTILVTSHLLSELLRLADAFAVIQGGSIIYQGSRSDLRKEEVCKTVIQTEQPGMLIKELRRRAPEVCCLLSDYREVSVIGPVDEKLLLCICKQLQVSDFKNRKSTIEEFLRWKMNG